MLSSLITITAALAAVANANHPSAGAVVQVNTRQKFQEYDGTGISEAFQRSLVLHQLNAATQKTALDYLFTTKGAGFTILRNGLGDSPTDPFDYMKSIAPVAPKSNTSQLNFVPFSREDEYQVWLSKQARARGVKYIYADAWSADGYMKSNKDNQNGGYLCGTTGAGANCTEDWRQSYANKIVRYIQMYEAEGLTIDYVGFLNEPDLTTAYASMLANGTQAADFLKVLYPTLRKAGIKAQIACCDNTGWEISRAQLAGIQAAGQEQTLGLVTSHGYTSPPGDPLNTKKKVWQTEWSTFDDVNYDWYQSGSQSEGLTWANHIQQAFSRSNVNGFLYWWGAANATDNESLLVINGTSELKVTKRLWAHAHFGKQFIRQGATRVGASVTGGSNLNVTAFANTDGSTAVQVINNGNDTETVTLSGLNVHSKQRNVQTYLTNQQNDLKKGSASIKGNQATAQVPGRSLLSFIV